MEGAHIKAPPTQLTNEQSRVWNRAYEKAAAEGREYRVDSPSKLPTEAEIRKGIPVYTGFIYYFPDAIKACAELSRIGMLSLPLPYSAKCLVMPLLIAPCAAVITNCVKF